MGWRKGEIFAAIIILFYIILINITILVILLVYTGSPRVRRSQVKSFRDYDALYDAHFDLRGLAS